MRFQFGFMIGSLGLALYVAVLPASALGSTSLDNMLRQESRDGRIKQIERLIRQGANINGSGEYGETALMGAIRFGRTRAALALLKLGANPNQADDEGRTPLLTAAADCNFQIVESLLKAGARINQADLSGRTPLIEAVDGSCVHAVYVLLFKSRQPVELNAEDHSFHRASDYADHPWITLLLKRAYGENNNDESGLPRSLLP